MGEGRGGGEKAEEGKERERRKGRKEERGRGRRERRGEEEEGEEGRRGRRKRSVQPAFDDSLSERLKGGFGQGLPRTCAGTQKAEATGAKRMAVPDSDPFYFVKKRK